MTQLLSAPARRPGRAFQVAIWIALGVALGALLSCAYFLATQAPLPGRAEADPTTGLLSCLADLAARLTATAALGLAAALAALVPLQDGRITTASNLLARLLGRVAQLWFVSSLLMTFVNSAFTAGVPLSLTLRLEIWWYLLGNTPSSIAWLANAVVALVTAVVAYRARRASAFALVWVAGAAVTIFVAVTGNVSVGLDHDWATDAAATATAAGVLLASAAWGLLAAALVGVPPEPGLRAYHRLELPLLVLLALGYSLVAWQQLAGQAPWAEPAGIPILAGGAVWLGLLGNWWWRRRNWPKVGEPQLNSLARDAALVILAVACLSAAAHLPPPRFLVPQTSQVNYLGYDVDVPATFALLAGPGRPNLLWALLCALAISGYLWGVGVVRRSGRSWPVSRTIFWLAGWLLMLYLATSGLWMYSTAVFSWHMLVHMTVNMMVPVLCVLGAPLSLWALARTAPGERPRGLADLLAEVGQNRLVRVLLSPPVLWLNYVSSLFLVYFTPLFGWLMRYHWAHQLMLLHFMVAGYLFFNMLVGPDRGLWRLPYLVKFALLISVMPFHAIFAVGIMMSRTVIGESFYRAIDVSWVSDLLADQNIAGQITWFTGEVPAFIAVVLLAAQWFREDTDQAKAEDDLVTTGDDDELDAYNDMLAQLAERDRNPTAKGELDDQR